MQKAILELRAGDLYAISHHEAALEVARRNTTVEEDPLNIVVNLSASDHKAPVFDRYGKLVVCEPRHGERNPIACRTRLLDIVRRVTVSL